MAGEIFAPGEVKLRPGAYFRVINAGAQPQGIVPQGTVAVLFRSAWGPLGRGKVFEGGETAVKALYGAGGTTDMPKQAFSGGAKRILPVRLGAGGAKGSTTLVDTTASPGVNVITLTARYEGARALTVTIRDNLADAGKRELLVLEGAVQVQPPILFARGGGEVDALVAAVAAAGATSLVTAAKLAAGTGLLKAINQQVLTGGTDPAITAGDYTAALALLDNQPWNILAVDSEDTAVQSTVAAYISRVQTEGKRVLAVLGEPTSVAFDTRATDAAAFNSPAVMYVGNGFIALGGATVEGAKAAAWVAGRIASGAVTKSFTHEVVNGATAVVGVLTIPEVDKALTSGMLVFTTNAVGQVHITRGINTLVTPSADQDAGWKKIRRTRTRYNLMDRVGAAWDPLVGNVDNSGDGRATLIQAAQAAVNAMIGEGALLGGTVTEDAANPPAGDAAYFLVAVDDLDSAETLYATFGFRFSA